MLNRLWIGSKGILFLIIWHIPAQGAAQSPESLRKSFLAAYHAQDTATARSWFSQLLSTDTLTVAQIGEEAEAIYLGQWLNSTTTPNRTDLDTLNTIYRIMLLNWPRDRQDWIMKMVLLGMQYPDYYSDETMEGFLRELFRKQRDECPLMIIDAWVNNLIRRYEKGEVSLDELVLDWIEVEDVLQNREYLEPEDRGESLRMHRRLHHAMRSAVPDCDKMTFKRKDPGAILRESRRKITVFEPLSFYYLLAMQNCGASVGEDSLYAALSQDNWDPYFFRVAAARSMFREQYAECLQRLEKAIQLENRPEIKALDLVKAANIHASMKDYKSAAKALKEAMEWAPEWGQPYLQMADLLVSGTQDCRLSPFDQKAVYWLAIDYCSQARNVDLKIGDEANRRIYQYQKRAPSKSEVAFKGLTEGDTWPLRCWMETVTTVRVY